MRFVSATGLPRGSYSKSSDFLYRCWVRVTGGSRQELFGSQSAKESVGYRDE
jgi:hypothetical protein